MGYRYSNEFIQRWSKRLVWIMCIGIALAFLLAGGVLMLHEAMGVAEGSTTEYVLGGVGIAGAVIGVLAVVGCLWTASILGGLSLHPRGWIPGALLPAWMFGGVFLLAALETGGGLGTVLYLLGFAPIIAVFFRMGRQAKVPIYLRSPQPGSPRVYATEGDGDFTGTGHEMDADRGDVHIRADRDAER